jgi:hypothetical protein
VFSLLYDTFFESIIFDDIGSLKSPFSARLLETSIDSDRKIRVHVHYTSNLSSGKEVIIAATTFGLREMLRVCGGRGGVFCSDLSSEHCRNAKTYISVVHPPSDIFDNYFCSLANLKEKNPLRQEFMFYRGDENVPTVLCNEVTYEPRIPLHVSVAFLTLILYTNSIQLYAQQK